jgi:hypothetical protein
MFRSYELSREDIQYISGAIVNKYRDQRIIMPSWRRGISNAVWNSSSGDGDGGDRVISHRGYEVDGDLLFTVGWGDGFAVRRLNDDGSMTKIYHNDNALYRDTASTYNHISGIALNKASKKVVLMSYNVNGYSIYDYSDIATGGVGVLEPRPSSQYFIDTDGIRVDRAGTHYENGLVSAGEWVYVGDWDASHYKKFPRRNMVTGVEEIIDGTTQFVAGSKAINRNGYRFELSYDEVNDRVFYFSYYNANFAIIENASTATPEVLFCDMSASGLGDDNYESGLFIEDPVNAPNIMYVANYDSVVKIDITPCYTGAGPTVLKRLDTDSKQGQAFSAYYRFGTKYHTTSGDATDRLVVYPDFIPSASDRGYNMLDGWVDVENENVVGVYRHDYTTEDTSNGRGRSYRSDYSSPIFKMYSTNSTPYWIKVGYGYDGHGFYVWDDTIGPYMHDNYEIKYGDYTLDGNLDIGKVYISGFENYIIPSGCSLNVFVSNDGENSWEAYNYSNREAHIFTSVGNTLKVKILANGTPVKGPYKLHQSLRVHFAPISKVERESNIKYKVTRGRLSGKI